MGESGEEAAVDNGLFGQKIAELNIHSRLKESLGMQGFERLTKIQELAFKPVYEDGDVLIKSATGSGKTIAYVLPLVQRVLDWTAENRIDRSYGTLGIVLVPTRELAEQVEEVLRRTLQKCSFIVTGCIKGGEQKKKEKARLRNGVHILVATIGRLVDHLRTTESFNVSKLKYLVLDEADRLLDMGYEKDITTIKQILSAKKAPIEKSILVSATLGPGIQRLSHFVLKNPTQVGLEAEGDDTQEQEHAPYEEHDDTAGTLIVPPTLTQHFVVCPTRLRLVLLLAMIKWKMLSSQIPLRKRHGNRENIVFINAKIKRQKINEDEHQKGVKIIVFMSSSDSVEYHYRLLSSLKVKDKSKHAFQQNRMGNKAAEKQDRKEKKMATRKMQAAANQHLDFDDEDGYQDFNEQDQQSAYNFEDEWNQTDEELGYIPFLNTDIFKLHGNMSQIDRTSIYESFKRAPNGVLFATDVASRGLDMPGVRWIIQYDPAPDEKSYTHRIGRTARAGKPGDAVLFLQPHEQKYIGSLSGSSDMKINKLTVEVILFHLAQDFGGSHLLECASLLHRYCERAATKDAELRRLSAVGFNAYVRAYTTYPKRFLSIFNSNALHLGHVAKSFAILKNPSHIKDLAASSMKDDGYVPAHIKKSRDKERFADGGTGMTREEEALAADKKAFRKPMATSRVGQFSEFSAGDPVFDAPPTTGKVKRKRK
eukprot:TRINITY_DN9381_c0_g1_i1.p1 TRINITY_DN9381_c0_g1~~TRINITY_DN9381_c0_g1_i1.p1  ORF type:complete len:707 (+),score=152.60 TRINITY_DN9381_c0_g1_i1:68-2188(+)